MTTTDPIPCQPPKAPRGGVTIFELMGQMMKSLDRLQFVVVNLPDPKKKARHEAVTLFVNKTVNKQGLKLDKCAVFDKP